ncbi:MAG TPA: HypC/HybG/HupF family hydrogenase formation chaperone [Candidatus Eisenbacteria bacterium]|nr:HypC/HybG/HupF family hydrogenase formation chaperone [Candidatus Eisenbacteria bacterium]
MCLSRPGRVLRRDGTMVEVEAGGRTRWYSALARPEVRPGDRVLTHANLVLTILTTSEADQMETAVAELLAG